MTLKDHVKRDDTIVERQQSRNVGLRLRLASKTFYGRSEVETC